MKKLKLLSSLSAITVLGSGVALTSTSCSNNNDKSSASITVTPELGVKCKAGETLTEALVLGTFTLNGGDFSNPKNQPTAKWVTQNNSGFEDTDLDALPSVEDGKYLVVIKKGSVNTATESTTATVQISWTPNGQSPVNGDKQLSITTEAEKPITYSITAEKRTTDESTFIPSEGTKPAEWVLSEEDTTAVLSFTAVGVEENKQDWYISLDETKKGTKTIDNESNQLLSITDPQSSLATLTATVKNIKNDFTVYVQLYNKDIVSDSPLAIYAINITSAEERTTIIMDAKGTNCSYDSKNNTFTITPKAFTEGASIDFTLSSTVEDTNFQFGYGEGSEIYIDIGTIVYKEDNKYTITISKQNACNFVTDYYLVESLMLLEKNNKVVPITFKQAIDGTAKSFAIGEPTGGYWDKDFGLGLWDGVKKGDTLKFTAPEGMTGTWSLYDYNASDITKESSPVGANVDTSTTPSTCTLSITGTPQLSRIYVIFTNDKDYAVIPILVDKNHN